MGNKRKGGNEGKRKQEHPYKGVGTYFAAPYHDGPVANMQTQMEVRNLKAARRVAAEVSNELFRDMQEKLVEEKTDDTNSDNWDRGRGRNEGIPTIQSRISRSNIEDQLKIGEDETDARKDRKSYVLKI